MLEVGATGTEEEEEEEDFITLQTTSKRAGVAVTLCTRIWEVLDSILRNVTSYRAEDFRGFLQSLQENVRAVSRLCHNRFFLPNPFQFICTSSNSDTALVMGESGRGLILQRAPEKWTF
jgi:hypothetical protein